MELPVSFIIEPNTTYLCYMTPENILNIVTEQELSLKTFESNIRRFYIVSSNLSSTLFNIQVFTTGFNKYGYETLIQVNKSNPKLRDFKYNFSTTLIDQTNKPIFDNAIPLDILITSMNDNELNSGLRFIIEKEQLI